MPRRLKVYVTRLGFFESVVAAPSQKAALQAWGVHQDLFAAGEARVTDDEAASAALSHPGVPLKRAIGSDGAFSLDPDPPQVGETTGGGKRAPRPPPDRAALDAAEKELRRLEAAQARGEAEFVRRREALAAEEADARRAWSHDRKAAEQAVQRERRAYRNAGGKP